MFRVTTKKKKRGTRIRVLVHHDEKDDDNQDNEVKISRPIGKKSKSSSSKRKRSKNQLSASIGPKSKQATIIRSFDHDEDDDDDNDFDDDGRSRETKAKYKTKKKRKGGLGFGGMILPDVRSNHDDEDISNEASTSAYDSNALARLKAEQMYKAKAGVDENRLPVKNEEKLRSSGHDKDLPSINEEGLGGDDFVSFDGNSTVLSGDAAHEASNSTGSHERDNQTMNFVDPDDVFVDQVEDQANDRSNEWEEEIARRAGISLSSGSGITGTRVSSKQNGSHITGSISELREEVSTALGHLQNQQEDLDQAYKRRFIDVGQVREEWTKQDAELKDAGKALEYYQELRLELASWIGALRDLQTKVVPLQETLRHLEKEHVGQWEKVENDVMSELDELGLLHQVLGRQPPPSMAIETEIVLDEFGRDVKSQCAREREKRIEQRRVVQRERALMAEEGSIDAEGGMENIFLSRSQVDELKERRQAINEALELARSELDDKYTSLPRLGSVFDEWSKSYPEEYRQCFAGMSLADLASALIQVDLCSSMHPLHWTGTSFYFAEAFQKLSKDVALLEETPLYRTTDKVLVPAVEQTLLDRAYDLLSKAQSQNLSNFVRQIKDLMPPSNILVDKLFSQLANYIRSELNSIAVIIPNRTISQSIPTEESHAEAFSLTFVTKTQLRRNTTILLNIMQYWCPILNKQIAECVLDFASSRFLFLLSSLKVIGAESDKDATQAFTKVWKSLCETSWLEDSSFFVLAAPIRAAAAAYRMDGEVE